MTTASRIGYGWDDPWGGWGGSSYGPDYGSGRRDIEEARRRIGAYDPIGYERQREFDPARDAPGAISPFYGGVKPRDWYDPNASYAPLTGPNGPTLINPIDWGTVGDIFRFGTPPGMSPGDALSMYWRGEQGDPTKFPEWLKSGVDVLGRALTGARYPAAGGWGGGAESLYNWIGNLFSTSDGRPIGVRGDESGAGGGFLGDGMFDPNYVPPEFRTREDYDRFLRDNGLPSSSGGGGGVGGRLDGPIESPVTGGNYGIDYGGAGPGGGGGGGGGGGFPTGGNYGGEYGGPISFSGPTVNFGDNLMPGQGYAGTQAGGYNPFDPMNLYVPMSQGIDEQTAKENARLREEFGASGMRWSSPLLAQQGLTARGAAQDKAKLMSELMYRGAQDTFNRQMQAAQMNMGLGSLQDERERKMAEQLFGMGQGEQALMAQNLQMPYQEWLRQQGGYLPQILGAIGGGYQTDYYKPLSTWETYAPYLMTLLSNYNKTA